MQPLEQITQQARTAIADSQSLEALDEIRVRYLGKKGELTDLLQGIGKLEPSERPKAGQLINQVKRELHQEIEDKKQHLQQAQLNARLSQETLDVTLPGRGQNQGSIHPISKSLARIEDFFSQAGFELCVGPEVETEHYNFEALNIPSHHPARAMHDTFYFGDGRLLRTHTSPVQIRAMEQRQPPVKLIAPGKVYRCDSDVTHTPMFHQVEGLVIDQSSSFSELKGLLHSFMEHYFEQNLDSRFRPSYFPFTEPSAEMDIACVHCQGKGCRLCKYTGWLEVLGCGMVHPKVLEAMGLDSDIYQGYAFGLGVDRLTMLRYGIDDLRLMFEGDLRFLKQF